MARIVLILAIVGSAIGAVVEIAKLVRLSMGNR
jgi:hypothetical protein